MRASVNERFEDMHVWRVKGIGRGMEMEEDECGGRDSVCIQGVARKAGCVLGPLNLGAFHHGVTHNGFVIAYVE